MSEEKRSPDRMETATPEQWAADQDRLVRQAVTFAADGAPEVAARLERAAIGPEEIRGVADLARIPVLSKDDLPALQAKSPPFGGMLAVPVEKLRRVEKHFTISREWPGPDTAISIEPDELQDLVKGAEALFQARGGSKTVLDIERPVIDFAYAYQDVGGVAVALGGNGDAVTRWA